MVVCNVNHTKSYWYIDMHNLIMRKHLTSRQCWNATLEHENSITAQETHDAWIVLIFGMCIES